MVWLSVLLCQVVSEQLLAEPLSDVWIMSFAIIIITGTIQCLQYDLCVQVCVLAVTGQFLS